MGPGGDEIRIRKIASAAALLLVLLATVTVACAAEPLYSTEQVEVDLEFLRRTVDEVHPALVSSEASAAFEIKVNELLDGLDAPIARMDVAFEVRRRSAGTPASDGAPAQEVELAAYLPCVSSGGTALDGTRGGTSTVIDAFLQYLPAVALRGHSSEIRFSAQANAQRGYSLRSDPQLPRPGPRMRQPPRPAGPELTFSGDLYVLTSEHTFSGAVPASGNVTSGQRRDLWRYPGHGYAGLLSPAPSHRDLEDRRGTAEVHPGGCTEAARAGSRASTLRPGI